MKTITITLNDATIATLAELCKRTQKSDEQYCNDLFEQAVANKAYRSSYNKQNWQAFKEWKDSK